MRRRWLMAAGVLLVAVVLLVWWQRQRAPTAPPAVAFPAPASDASQRIEQLLGDGHAFRNDVLFLLAATLRDRCQPAQAGVLARMANRASLPVLAAVSAVTQQDPSLDRPIYQYIQHRADATPCGQTLQMPLAGGRRMAVDIEQYARTGIRAQAAAPPVGATQRQHRVHHAVAGVAGALLQRQPTEIPRFAAALRVEVAVRERARVLFDVHGHAASTGQRHLQRLPAR
ncbi:hypothetical protein, partial [Stenotrophomonas maltophilia]|uniref:hypothetical protein n=1 Tax=Stenotrophomonas maltophilia TaxID=40324 RepID=UPI002EDAF72D